ncbi:MAG: amino acid permease [Bombella apis]|nr:amino acid permease [Bombella apis]
MKSSLWRKKTITAPVEPSGLKRVFDTWQLIAIGVGVTIGAGLFSLTGVASGLYAGSAIPLSFLIAGIAASFAGLCYAELSGMIPSGGSAYSYAYAALGEVVAWVIGWDLILEYTVSTAAVASSWSGYIVSFLKGWGIVIDPRLLHPPMTLVTLPDGQTAHAWFNAPCLFILWLVTFMLTRGVKESARMNGLVVAIKFCVLVGMIIAALPHINMAHFHPFIAPNTGQFGIFGFSGVMRAAGMAFLAYIGFDIVSTAAQDTKNPQKSMPFAILGSLIICTIIYVAFSAVLIGVVDYHRFANDPSPVATVMDVINLPWLGLLIKGGICLGYLSVLYGLLMGQSRILLAMAQDGLLPAFFRRLNPKSHTPVPSHMLSFLVSGALACCLPINILADMASIGTLAAFIIVCAGVIALRFRAPHAPRTFRLPGGPWLIPGLGILSCGSVMLSMSLVTWIRLIIWLAIGAVIYFAYSIKHSHLRTKHHPTSSRPD